MFRDPRARSGGESWAKWVRALQGASGSYVIRSRSTKRVLYVGESHKGRLYDTITRHFRSWSGEHAGTTYSRHAVEVAVLRSAPSVAYRLQVRLIRTLRPRDNQIHKYKVSGPRSADDHLDFID